MTNLNRYNNIITSFINYLEDGMKKIILLALLVLATDGFARDDFDRYMERELSGRDSYGYSNTRPYAPRAGVSGYSSTYDNGRMRIDSGSYEYNSGYGSTRRNESTYCNTYSMRGKPGSYTYCD